MFCMILFASSVNMSVFGSSVELDFLKLADPMFSICRNYGIKVLELFESGLGIALDQSNGDCAFDNTREHPKHLLQSAINLRPRFDIKKECYIDDEGYEYHKNSDLFRSTCSNSADLGTSYNDNVYPSYSRTTKQTFDDLFTTDMVQEEKCRYYMGVTDTDINKSKSLSNNFPNRYYTRFGSDSNDVISQDRKYDTYVPQPDVDLCKNIDNSYGDNYDIQSYVYDNIFKLEKNIKFAKKSDIVSKQLKKMISSLNNNSVFQYMPGRKTEVNKNPEKKFWAITLNDDIVYFGVIIGKYAYRFKLSDISEILNRSGDAENEYLLKTIEQSLNENYDSIVSTTNARYYQDVEIDKDLSAN